MARKNIRFAATDPDLMRLHARAEELQEAHYQTLWAQPIDWELLREIDAEKKDIEKEIRRLTDDRRSGKGVR